MRIRFKQWRINEEIKEYEDWKISTEIKIAQMIYENKLAMLQHCQREN